MCEEYDAIGVLAWETVHKAADNPTPSLNTGRRGKSTDATDIAIAQRSTKRYETRHGRATRGLGKATRGKRLEDTADALKSWPARITYSIIIAPSSLESDGGRSQEMLEIQFKPS